MTTIKLFLLVAIFVFLALFINARREPFIIVGKVYCDACHVGFDTSKCSYILGARVEINCYDKVTLTLKYSIGAMKDSTEDDHQDQLCYAMLVNTAIPSCRMVDPRSNMATIILTGSNGTIAYLCHANAMGFFQDEAEVGLPMTVSKVAAR